MDIGNDVNTTGCSGGAATTSFASSRNLFPAKLHRLLEENQHERIISWQPHGLCFIVRERDEFVKDVMPRYFSQSKMPSFLRQLNLYGFRRLETGLDKGGYYHRLFMRGNSQLCDQITRGVGKTGGHVHGSAIIPTNGYPIADGAPQPNFYSMDPLPSSRMIDSSSEEGSKKKNRRHDQHQQLNPPRQEEQQEAGTTQAISSEQIHSKDNPSARVISCYTTVRSSTTKVEAVENSLPVLVTCPLTSSSLPTVAVGEPPTYSLAEAMALKQNTKIQPVIGLALPSLAATSLDKVRKDSASNQSNSWYHNLEPVDISVNQNRWYHENRRVELLKIIQQDKDMRAMLSALLAQDKEQAIESHKHSWYC